jgi:hypothetical protein
MTMTDDQGGVEPVMPTDAVEAPVESEVEPQTIPVAEPPVEPEPVDASTEAPVPASVASVSVQGNFPSARVRAREDQMDAAAILRWENETGQVWEAGA